MIKVFDTVLPPPAQDEIEQVLLGWNFPWFHYANTNYAEHKTRDDDVPQFTHGFIRDDNKNSPFENIPRVILDKMGLEPKSILRAKANLLPREPQSFTHPPHIDDRKPHIAFIYYVNESDGDTHFYKNGEVIQTVSPKKGSGVMFMGNIYHASSSPVKSRFRIVINFNLALSPALKELLNTPSQ